MFALKESIMKIDRVIQRSPSHHPEDGLPIYAAADSSQKQAPKKGEKLKEEMDALVDEIDEVLEENAEEFVKNYVQRGGE